MIVIASAHVLAAWEAVYRRYEAHLSNKLSPELVATGTDAWKTLQSSPFFPEARKVVMANLGRDDSGAAEARLISWLLLFDRHHQTCLLEVIAAHDCVQRSDVDRLIAKVRELYRQEQGDVVFTIKEADDFGGIQRIFDRTPGLARQLQLGRPVQQIVRLGKEASKAASEGNTGPKPRLIVAHDVGVSGGQVANALERYYLATEWSEDLARMAEREHYHRLSEREFADFKKGLSTFGEVWFIFGLYTPEAEQKIREAYGSGISPDALKFYGRLSDGSQTLERAAFLHPTRTPEFAALLRDDDLIRSKFEIPEKAVHSLMNDRDRTERINLIVRMGSVTKRVTRLFTLKPLRPGVEPLFERIEEHPQSHG